MKVLCGIVVERVGDILDYIKRRHWLGCPPPLPLKGWGRRAARSDGGASIDECPSSDPAMEVDRSPSPRVGRSRLVSMTWQPSFFFTVRVLNKTRVVAPHEMARRVLCRCDALDVFGGAARPPRVGSWTRSDASHPPRAASHPLPPSATAAEEGVVARAPPSPERAWGEPPRVYSWMANRRPSVVGARRGGSRGRL